MSDFILIKNRTIQKGLLFVVLSIVGGVIGIKYVREKTWAVTKEYNELLEQNTTLIKNASMKGQVKTDLANIKEELTKIKSNFATKDELTLVLHEIASIAGFCGIYTPVLKPVEANSKDNVINLPIEINLQCENRQLLQFFNELHSISNRIKVKQVSIQKDLLRADSSLWQVKIMSEAILVDKKEVPTVFDLSKWPTKPKSKPKPAEPQQPKPAAPPVVDDTPKETTEITLLGIAEVAKVKSAIFPQGVGKEGETVGGMKIIKILEKAVIIEKNNVKYIVRQK